jgi:hypothetical protein
MDHGEVEECVMRELQGRCGQAWAVERWELVRRVFGDGADIPRNDSNLADRVVRRAVEALRGRGLLVCNLGEGSGWFLAGSPQEYQAFRAAYGSHAFPILENIREMDRTAKQTWPNALQPKLI